MLRAYDGGLDGLLVMGQNPAVGSTHAGLQRRALSHLKWLVVRDLAELETATFWRDSPEVKSGELRTEDIQTEVFLMPAASHVEKDGHFTNTQRLLQWHDKALDPPGDARSELWFMHHLFKRVRRHYAGSQAGRDWPIVNLTWDYPEHGPIREPDAEAVLKEIGGFDIASGKPVAGFGELSDDGSTAAGCWIYAGCYKDGVNQTRRRDPGDLDAEGGWVSPEWAWAWPANRRILYNRASADPDGNPWSERKRYVWWDAGAGKWDSLGDDPDFEPDKPPDYRPPEGATGLDAIGGADPFIIHPDGLGWIWVASGLVDGPLPAHYEPHESPFRNRLYGQDGNPTREVFDRADNPYNPPGSEVFPFVMTTYRLTEHHTAGGMSRTVRYLAELQPEMFCEVSPSLAAQRGLEHGGWATIVTTRTAIEARVLVTDRMAPLRVLDRQIEQVGLPYHWGTRGFATGDAANALLPLALDRNVHISEYKVATCDIQPGRRPRGRALTAYVAEYRRRAGVSP
jgi:formate dehydrogenase major subunit